VGLFLGKICHVCACYSLLDKTPTPFFLHIGAPPRKRAQAVRHTAQPFGQCVQIAVLSHSVLYLVDEIIVLKNCLKHYLLKIIVKAA